MVLGKNIRSLSLDGKSITTIERIKFVYKEYKCIIIIEPYYNSLSIHVNIYKNKKSKTLPNNPLYEIRIPLNINTNQQYNGLYYNEIFNMLHEIFKHRYHGIHIENVLQQCAKTLAHIRQEEMYVNIFGI